MNRGARILTKNDVHYLQQLLQKMRELTNRIDKLRKSKDGERLSQAKREMLELQRRVDEVI
jgi:hypothetical protein